MSEVNGETGNHKGPSKSTSSSLAPTDVGGLFVRLLLIEHPQGDALGEVVLGSLLRSYYSMKE
jgi:hypothetical protein